MKVLNWITFLLLLVFLTFYYFRILNSHIFHIDEYDFIRKTYYYDLFFVKKDLDDPRWYTQDSPYQPKLGPYIYGFALHLSGIKDVEDHFKSVGFNDFQVDNKMWWQNWWSKKLENLSQEMALILQPVWIGRKIAVLFTLGAMTTLFFFASKIKGILFGSLATFILGINSLMFAYGRRAMTDSIQLFFFFANLLLALNYIEALKAKNRKIVLLVSLALGVNAALGLGVKISGILIFIFIIILFFLLLSLNHRTKSSAKLVISSFVVISTGFIIVFVALHPYLYKNTFQNFLSIFTNRMEAAYDYQLTYPGSAVYSLENAIEVIVKRTLLPSGDYANFKLWDLPTDLLLFALGILLLAKKAVSRLRVKEVSGELLLGVWTVIVMVSLVFYLKNNWPRYFLPTVSVIVITQAYAITAILQAFWAPLKKVLVD